MCVHTVISFTLVGVNEPLLTLTHVINLNIMITKDECQYPEIYTS